MAGSITDQTTRRAVIGGAAAVGAGAVLAACGAGSDSGSTSDPTDAGSTGGDTGGSAGDALAKTSDIPVGGGKIFPNQKVVVTQPAEGEFKAFSAVCTHQGCIVAAVVKDTIECNCHGSRYSAEDGSVKKGPAPAPLAPKKVTVEGTEIVLG
ncbi:Rieske (2Fe-2S) protein [Aeromicrobium terrae]|uniref:Cytochrome bc1 complex Rieske iron-sulfur subunit n=1 Tax=Aeromicrobium terrae TaxID=2498846 RepID=A0A5C8NQM3_9ACTN|nr:Rieske (2Fe-2S) protein [Aeromicrobium terrae]TXL63175.1 Rieske (2Fe-2S) protein [Aeromicrobium terrae]